MSLHVLLLHTQKGRKTEIVVGLTELQQETRPRDHVSSKDNPSPIGDERPRGFSGGWRVAPGHPRVPAVQVCGAPALPWPMDLDGF